MSKSFGDDYRPETFDGLGETGAIAGTDEKAQPVADAPLSMWDIFREGLHYCGDCHTHCRQTLEAQSLCAENT